MDHEIEVFYVSVELAGRDGARQDVAKFFAQAHADEHAGRLGEQAKALVAVRVEKMIAQHPAHRPG